MIERLPVRIDAGVNQGELLVTFHAAEVFLNNLTSPYRDGAVMTPEYKVVAVNIEKWDAPIVSPTAQ